MACIGNTEKTFDVGEIGENRDENEVLQEKENIKSTNLKKASLEPLNDSNEKSNEDDDVTKNEKTPLSPREKNTSLAAKSLFTDVQQPENECNISTPKNIVDNNNQQDTKENDNNNNNDINELETKATEKCNKSLKSKKKRMKNKISAINRLLQPPRIRGKSTNQIEQERIEQAKKENERMRKRNQKTYERIRNNATIFSPKKSYSMTTPKEFHFHTAERMERRKKRELEQQEENERKNPKPKKRLNFNAIRET